MNNIFKVIIRNVAPIAIQAAEGALTGGSLKLGFATGIAQNLLMQLSGSTPGLTPQDAANTELIRKTVQETFDQMKKRGMVKALQEVTPILD